MPPRSRRSSKAPNLPRRLSQALSAARKKPQLEENWERLEEVCRDLDRPEEAAALYSEVMESSKVPLELRIQLGLRAADFCEEWFEETEPVLEMLRRVLEMDPNHELAFDRLTVLLTVAGRWTELLAAYNAALSAAESDEVKVRLLEEASRVARDFAGDSELGSDYLKQLLFIRPDDDQLAAILEKRLEEQKRHQDLVDVWSVRLDVLEPAQALRTRLNIAERQLDALMEAEAALESIDRFLDAGGAPAQALELLAKTADSEVADVKVRRAALGKLKAIEASAQNFPAVVSAIERQLQLVSDEAEQTELHREASELLARIDQPRGALDHATEVMRLLPEDVEARQLARELAQRLESMDRFVEALVASADRADRNVEQEGGGALRVELLLEAAQLCEQTLLEPARAIDLYVRLADDPAAEAAALLHTTRRLCELLDAAGDRERLLVYLVARADLEEERGQRHEVLGRAARLAEQLNDIDQALGIWNVRLDDDAGDLEALSAKIDLLEQSQRHAGLVEALEARVQVCPDGEQARADLVRAALLYHESLGELAQAIQTWRRIEERFGRTSQTVDHLVLLLRQTGLHEEMARLLEECIAAVETEGTNETARQVQHLALLGDTYRSALERPEDSIEAYRKALSLAPQDEASRQGLRALFELPELARPASECLADALRVAGEKEELIALAETRIAVTSEKTDQASILREVAELEEQAGRPNPAATALSRAFALWPSSDTEAELLRVGELVESWDTVARAYQEAIAGCEDEQRVFALHVAHGRICELRLSNPSAATYAYQEGLVLAPHDTETVKSLIRVGLVAQLDKEAAWGLVTHAKACAELPSELSEHYRQCADASGRWDEVLAGVADQIAAAEDLSSELSHDLKQQLAIWYRDCAVDHDSAEMVLKRAVADSPREESLRMLAELQRRTPGRPLIDTLLALSDVVGGELAALREAGEVAWEGQDRSLTRKIFEQAFAIASRRLAAEHPDGRGPDAPDTGRSEAEAVTLWAIEGLVELAQAEQEPKRALELLDEATGLPFTPGQLVKFRHLGAETAAQGGLEEDAVRMGERLLEDVPDHGPTISLLSGLHEAAGRLEQLLELRQKELSLNPPLERRLFLRLDQSRVMGQLSAPIDERLEILAENLREAPGHEESIEERAGLLLSQERFDEATRLLEEQAAIVMKQDRVRAASMWLRAGELAERHLGDLERLQKDFSSAVMANPERAPLDRLADLAHQAGDTTQEISWLEQRLTLTPQAEEGEEATAERRDVVQRLGAALVLAEEFTQARELLEVELSVDPGCEEARRLLVDLYASFEEWEQLSRLLTEGLQYATDDDMRISYLRRAAVVERRHLGQVERAVNLLDQALSLAPADRGLKILLADCLLEHGGFERARGILHGLLEEFGRRRTKERASVHKLLARIARADGAPDEALSQAEEAAKIERMDPGILMLLAELAQERGELDRAEQAYRTLALVASRKSASSQDEGELVGEAAILFELYQIAQVRENEEQSKELLSSALEVAMRSSEEAIRLEERLRAVGKVGLLLEAIEQQLESAEGATAGGLLVTRAIILEKNGQFDEALGARLAALRLLPTSGRLIEATRRLADRVGATDAWLEVLKELAEQHADKPEVAGDLWHRLGRAAEATQDLEKAASLYERAQATGYRPRRTFLALDAVLMQLGDMSRVWSALERFVETPGASESGETFADALYRLAEIELNEGRVQQGEKHLAAAKALRPDDERTLAIAMPVVRNRAASPGLVRLFLEVASAVGDEQTQLLAVLEAAQLSDVEAAELDAGVRLARRLQDGGALRTLLTRRIEHAESASSIEEVFDELLERAALAESDGEAELAVHLLEKAESLAEGSTATDLGLRAAALLVNPLGQTEQATARYERLLQMAPGDRRIWQPLLQLYQQAGRDDAVIACIDTVEERVEDPRDREVLRMARIRLMVSAGRLDEAEAALRKALEEQPESEEAALVLAELLRKAGRQEELQSLLVDLFDKAREREDAVQVSRYGLELAHLLPAAEAVDVLRSGLPWVTNDESYLRTLRSLYDDQASPDDVAEVLEHLVFVVEPTEAEQVSLELAQLRQEQGDDFGLGHALEIGHQAAPQSQRIADWFVHYLRNHDDYSRLSEMLLSRALARQEVDAALEELAEAAYIFDQNLGEPGRAAAAMLEAFSRRPDDVTLLRRAVDHLIAAGDLDGALERLAAVIAQEDELIVADVLELRARVLDRERGDDLESVEQAVSDLNSALEQLLPEEQEEEIQGRRLVLLERLRGMYAQQGDTDKERQMVLESSSHRQGRGDVAGAITTMTSWLEQHPDDLVVASRLGELATRASDAETAFFAYQKIFNATEGETKRTAVLELSRAAEKVGDPMRAREALEETFRELPEDEEVRSRLRHTYESAEAYRDLADLLMGEAASTSDPSARFSLLVEVGDLYLRAGDAGAACDVFEGAREVSPDSYLVTTKLARAYVDQGDVERAQTVLDAALEQHGKRRTPELALLQHGLAVVSEARGDVDGMFSWLEAALMSDRSNGEIAAELAIRAQEVERFDIAIKALQVIALNKSETKMSKAEAYYRQAQIAQQQGESKKALMLARRATTADADFAPAQDLISQLS